MNVCISAFSLVAPYKCLLLNMLIINTLNDPGLEEGHDGLNQVYGHNCATSYG